MELVKNILEVVCTEPMAASHNTFEINFGQRAILFLIYKFEGLGDFIEKVPFVESPTLCLWYFEIKSRNY